MKTAPDQPRLKAWHYFAGLAAAGLLLYWPSFGFSLTYFDDDILIRFQDFLRAPSALTEVFRRDILFSLDGSALYYRPLAALALVVQAHLGGTSLFVYRATNLLLHVFTAWLVFRLLLRLRYPTGPAYFFSMAFLLHPAAAQVVCWLPGNNNSMLAAAVLPAFISALDYWETGRWRHAAASSLLFAAAMLIKESAVGLVPACLLYRAVAEGKNPFRGGRALLAGWGAAFGLWLFLRSQALGGGLPVGPSGLFSSLAGNLPAVAAGVGYAVLPFKIAVIAAIKDSGWPAGLAAAALLAAGLFYPPRGSLRRAAFGFCWYLCFLLPGLVSPLQAAANFMPHRVYLSLPGVLMMLLETYPARALSGFKAFASAAAILLALFLGAFYHSGHYKSQMALWSRAAADSPSSELTRVGFGTALSAAGRLAEAEGEFRKAVALAPGDFGAYHNLGVVLAAEGRPAEALIQYDEALKLKPDLAEAHLSRGTALAAMGRREEALKSIGEALKIAPHYAEAYYQAGFLLAMDGRRDEAEKNYRAALGFRPSHAEAHLNLGVLLAASGRTGEAVEHYGASIRSNPALAEAYYNRGVSLAALGREPEAWADYAKAAELKPCLAEAQVNMGIMLAARGDFDGSLARYAQALRCRPGLPVAHNSAGISLVKLGRLDEALAEFGEALRLDPSYRDPARNIAAVSAMRKK